jgi:hypothetical protein
MFSADISWTDHNDQANREKREVERQELMSGRPGTSMSIATTTTTTRTIRSSKSKNESFSGSSFFRRRKSNASRNSLSSDGSIRSSSRAEPRSIGSERKPVQVPITPSVENTVYNPIIEGRFLSATQLTEELNPRIEEPVKPQANQTILRPKMSREFNREFNNITPKLRTDLEIRPRTLKVSSRGPLRTIAKPEQKPEYALVDFDALEKRPPNSRNRNAFAVYKSVNIAVQYSSVPDNRASMQIGGQTSCARAWKGTDEDNNICLGFTGLIPVSLSGTKCAAPHDADTVLNHFPRCFQNFVKVMDTIEAALALDQLQRDMVSVNTITQREMQVEHSLWIASLLESRILRQFSAGTKPEDPYVAYNRVDILDLDGSVGKNASSLLSVLS